MNLNSCETCTGDRRIACEESSNRYLGGFLELSIREKSGKMSHSSFAEFIEASGRLGLKEFSDMNKIGCQLGKIDFLDMLRHRTESASQDPPPTT